MEGEISRGCALRRFLHVYARTGFSVGTKSGQLEITLEADSCFCAEAYTEDLGLGQSDMRVNLGER